MHLLSRLNGSGNYASLSMQTVLSKEARRSPADEDFSIQGRTVSNHVLGKGKA